jgi:hypothetical protein
VTRHYVPLYFDSPSLQFGPSYSRAYMRHTERLDTMAFILIPTNIMIEVAHIMAAAGHKLGDNTKVKIAECANANFPRTDGNYWKYPRGLKKSRELVPFYTAFAAADKPVVTPKGKTTRKAAQAPVVASTRPTGAKNHKASCDCRFCQRVRGADSRKASPASIGKAGNVTLTLTVAQRDALLALLS